MLNILKTKISKNKITLLEKSDIEGEYRHEKKHFSPLSKEWSNSIYAYDKNTSKLLPTTDKIVISLMKSYFNLYSRRLERKIKLRRLRIRKRKLSINRILIGNLEVKHTNDKVIINIYVYNRQKKYYLNKIKKLVKRVMPKIMKIKQYVKKVKIVRLQALKTTSQVRNNKSAIFKSFYWTNKVFQSYEKLYNIKYIRKSLKKELLYIYYKQIMLFNVSKFNDTYLFLLKKILLKLYFKKIDINIIDLKYLYLDSDIFTQTLATKLRNRKNKLLRVIKRLLLKIKAPRINKNLLLGDKKKSFVPNITATTLLNSSMYPDINAVNKDISSIALSKCYTSNIKLEDTLDLENIEDKTGEINNGIIDSVMNTVKFKYIGGVRVQGSGRLTRRLIAARSIKKVRYIGSLKNLDSSYRGLSTALQRGYEKPNLQYAKVSSKTRIGSFGLKGWLSGY